MVVSHTCCVGILEGSGLEVLGEIGAYRVGSMRMSQSGGGRLFIV